jgi:hypothetical protein
VVDYLISNVPDTYTRIGTECRFAVKIGKDYFGLYGSIITPTFGEAQFSIKRIIVKILDPEAKYTDD